MASIYHNPVGRGSSSSLDRISYRQYLYQSALNSRPSLLQRLICKPSIRCYFDAHDPYYPCHPSFSLDPLSVGRDGSVREANVEANPDELF